MTDDRIVYSVALLLSAAGSAQGPADLVEQLRVPEQRTRAAAALQRCGAAGAQALWQALQRTRDERDAGASVLAETLAEFGSATAPFAGQIAATLEDTDEPLFGLLLRAVSNGATSSTHHRLNGWSPGARGEARAQRRVLPRLRVLGALCGSSPVGVKLARSFGGSNTDESSSPPASPGKVVALPGENWSNAPCGRER